MSLVKVNRIKMNGTPAEGLKQWFQTVVLIFISVVLVCKISHIKQQGVFEFVSVHVLVVEGAVDLRLAACFILTKQTSCKVQYFLLGSSSSGHTCTNLL